MPPAANRCATTETTAAGRAAWGTSTSLSHFVRGCFAVSLGTALFTSCQGKPLPANRSADLDEDLPTDGGNSNPPPVTSLKAKINEVMVTNTDTLSDAEGAFPPWIELYNPTDDSIDLSGVPFSDDLLLAGKWEFPKSRLSIIPPQGFLVVFCDGDTKAKGAIHTSFALAPGPLTLVLNKGADLFFFDASGLGADQSAGRSPEGNAVVKILASPTPGALNSAPFEPPQADFLRGDATEDSRVNVSDMSEIIAFLFRSEPGPPCLDRMDADDNGKVDVADVMRIGNALFRHGPPLAAPFPFPGPDPTDDPLPCRP